MESANSWAINNTVLHCPIDLTFDLNEVLTTITTNTSSTPDQDQQKVEDKETNSELMVSNLPTVATQGICMVCMEDFKQPFPGKKVPCGHVFHATCISTWISVSNSCPLCRSYCIISGTTD